MSIGALFERCAARFAAAGVTIYFDISPLLEKQWTGIPVVGAGLAGALLRAMPDRVRFFLDLRLVRNAAVADALRRGTALYLARDLACGRAFDGDLPLLGAGGLSVGLFPSVKPARRRFHIEASVVHDLSTLVTPQYHIRGNVEHHTGAILGDLESDDLIVAVSQATAEDLTAYLGIAPERIVVALNGASWPDWYEVAAANEADPATMEPYCLILGTREPRKNILRVFHLLEHAPALLESHRFVFAGRMGWLEEHHALPPALEDAVSARRILFAGYVGDYAKYRLLAGAAVTLYPSLFEGFGLPVLESLSAGTPCAASWSSSIPEVGGDLCGYFDPLSVTDFHRAVIEVVARREAEGAALAQACRAHARKFTWDISVARILERLEPLCFSE